MENNRFDELTRLIASFTSRRSIMQGVAAGGLGSLLGLSGAGVVPLFIDDVEATKNKKKRRKRRRRKKKRKEKKRKKKCQKNCKPSNDCEDASCNKKGKCRTSTKSDGTSCGNGQVCENGECITPCGESGITCAANADCCSGVCSCGENASADQCQASNYEQGFEENLDFWFNFTEVGGSTPPGPPTINRVPSGTNGISAKSGGFFALVGPGDNYQGGTTAFSTLGGYSPVFPNGGFDTSIDVFLDPGVTENGDFFAYTVALSKTDCAHIQDFIFYVGRTDDEFCVGTGTGVNSDTNPCAENANPFKGVSQAGWHTLRHVFSEQGGGVNVALSLLDASGANLNTWNIPVTQPGDPGGNRYGWFPVQKLDFLAIDNSTRNS